MTDFIPPFEWQRVLVEPWTENLSTTFWIVLMGFLITAACGLIGNYLILRRMALVGDAISHSVLPGMKCFMTVMRYWASQQQVKQLRSRRSILLKWNMKYLSR